LKKLSTIMREVRAYASKNDLKQTWTCYRQYGSKTKRKLRFSKSGKESIEKNYATHYLVKKPSSSTGKVDHPSENQACQADEKDPGEPF